MATTYSTTFVQNLRAEDIGTVAGSESLSLHLGDDVTVTCFTYDVSRMAADAAGMRKLSERARWMAAELDARLTAMREGAAA